MEVVFFDKEKHYPLMLLWWDERKFPATPIPLLPRTGVVIEKKGTPICAGFVYYTDSGFAMVDHLVADKRAFKADRDEAVDLVIDTLVKLAKENGFLVVSAATNLPHLKERYEEHGFKGADMNMTHMYMDLAHTLSSERNR